MTVISPKLFVSYSWTSEDHQKWVVDLATALRDAGVDVVLDKWDLREGHDAHHFMEQMVSNPEIKKVALVCDRSYAEKANGRAGGVGVEAQIISPELYAKQSQDKFVAVVVERGDDGKPFLPTYYSSRIFIDLSSDELYGRNFEQLLRWIFDKPVYVKPPLGTMPGFLLDGAKLSLGTTVYFQRSIDAIRGNKPFRAGALSEYLDRFSSNFGSLRLKSGEKDFDDHVVASIEQFTPYRNEAIEIFLSLAQHGPTLDERKALHRFFERIYPLMLRPENVGTSYEWDYDNFRFAVHELFLYAIACFLRYERFDVVAQLIRQPYYVGRASDESTGTVSFADFRIYMESLKHRNSRLNLRRLSLRADLLQTRAEGSGVEFQALMQADFTLYIRDCLDSLRQSKVQGWWPETLLHIRSGNRPFEIFARSQSTEYFNSLKCVFDVSSKIEFQSIFSAISEQNLRVPRWEFNSFNPSMLLGYEAMATLP